MATYSELYNLRSNNDLQNKIAVACVVAAEKIRLESTTTPNNINRLKWAKAVFENPVMVVERMMWTVLAQNKAATIAAITGASDTAIQAAVDDAVNVFATG